MTYGDPHNPSSERFLRALRGEVVDRPPVWLMRQAGRYLPEYQEIKAKYTFVERCKSPELAQEISLQPFRRFGMDGVVVFCDILMPLEAMGIDFSVPVGGPRLSPATTTTDDVAQLHMPNAETDYPYLMDTLRGLRTELSNQAAVIGFCGGPWTVGTYMISGGSKATREQLETALLNNNTFREALFAKLIPMLSEYLCAQADAGAQVLQIFESWAGLLSSEEHERVLSGPLTQIIANVRAHCDTPIILYGNDCGHLVTQWADTGCQGISIDWRQSLQSVRDQLGPHIALQGNLPPETLLTTPEQVTQETLAMLAAAPKTGHIANLGHGVLKETQPENVGAFVEAVKNSAAAS